MKTAVHIIPILKDNYAYAIEGVDRQCIIVDPGQVTPVQSFVMQTGLTPVAILNTHHHADHVAGNNELSRLYKIPVIGPEKEQSKIPSLTDGVKEGDVIYYAGVTLHVLETPGHTNGHAAFYDAENGNLFCGDTLFSMGCGRLIEGTPKQMFESLRKLCALPAKTLAYCGHEYTESNGRFALDADPQNDAVKKRMDEIKKLRQNNLPTLPVTIETELATNPFLRAADANEFAGLRARKDNF